MSPVNFGHELCHGRTVIAVAVAHNPSDIRALKTADAASELGVARARVTQFCDEGMFDYWRDSTTRMVSRESAEARKEYADYRTPSAK